VLRNPAHAAATLSRGCLRRLWRTCWGERPTNWQSGRFGRVTDQPAEGSRAHRKQQHSLCTRHPTPTVSTRAPCTARQRPPPPPPPLRTGRRACGSSHLSISSHVPRCERATPGLLVAAQGEAEVALHTPHRAVGARLHLLDPTVLRTHARTHGGGGGGGGSQGAQSQRDVGGGLVTVGDARTCAALRPRRSPRRCMQPVRSQPSTTSPCTTCVCVGVGTAAPR
jgi:hypothetical protein